MKVVCTLGVTPSVVTEFVDWMHRWGRRPSEIICIGTMEETVKQSFNVIKAALEDKFNLRKVRYIELPFEDPIKEEDFYTTVEKILDVVRGRAIFNLAGGRKNMVLAGYICAMLTGSKAYHIIHKDVKSFNVELEKVRYELEIVGKEPGKYKEFKEKLEKVLFPDPSEYEVIEIPVVPFPRIFIEVLKRGFQGKGTIHLDAHEITEILEYLGYLQISMSGKIIITEKGEKLLKLFEIL